jgi:hypothetical protein
MDVGAERTGPRRLPLFSPSLAIVQGRQIPQAKLFVRFSQKVVSRLRTRQLARFPATAYTDFAASFERPSRNNVI